MNRRTGAVAGTFDRAFIIHGYLGFPGEAWMPWLKEQLELKGYTVALPAMPHPDHPVISEWISFIDGLVGEPDDRTVMIAHSLGCQAVARYLEKIGGLAKSVRRSVFVAGGFPIPMSAAEADRRTGGDAVLRPWLTTEIDSSKVRLGAGACTVILSDNDPYIPLEGAKASYEKHLPAKIIIEHGLGHFNEDDAITELQSVLTAALG